MRLFLLLTLLPVPALAEPPVVEDAWRNGNTIHVTLSHPDTGWEHYADGWEVLTPDGTRVDLRVLTHPHEAEQPFTRSLTLTAPPAGPLFIRARCNLTGWSSETYPVRND